MQRRRVVVTGTGVISVLGDSRQALHDALCNGSSGIRPVEQFADPILDNPLVAELTSFDPANYLGQRNFRPLDRTSRLLASTAQLALDDSGWTLEMREKSPVGLVAGTTFCSVHTISQFDRRALVEGPSCASPLDFANTVINAAAGQTAIWHKLEGVNSTISTGITSGIEAIAYAASLIGAGHERAVLAGGVEELCIESLLGFQRAGLLAKVNGSGAEPPVPFDSRANGFALGEGAALLMLEDFDAAQSRGATTLAEVKGYASSFDCSIGERQTTCERRAATIARSIRAAIAAATATCSIDAVSVSANGNRFFDRSEALGIERAFNGQSRSLPVTAQKSMLGESLGASAAIQGVDMIETLRDGRLAGVRGFQLPDDSFPLRGVSAECRTTRPRNCLINSVGLDGHCCSLILGL
ncbi:MAG TPA: beta-ketoacyl synthase N-terminal-like domain-containing protein [Pirellulaceae bacterium]|nr:beta-ketoacyl synthase N-terminal-like domain-containing protein [Pirellulaceae bacterium]